MKIEYNFYAIKSTYEGHPHEVGKYGDEVIQILSNEEEIMDYAYEYWKDAQKDNNPLMGVLVSAEIRGDDGGIDDSYIVLRKIGEADVNSFFKGWVEMDESDEIKGRPTKGDKKAKRRYNRYRKGGPKGYRKNTGSE